VEEDKNKKDESKGFAGLSSLVSDVGTSPPPSAKKEPSNTSGASSSPPPPTSQTAQPQPSQQHQTYQEPAQPPSSGSSGSKWVFGIAAVIGVLWLIGQSDKSPTSPAPAYSPPTQSATPSYSPPAEPQAPSRPQESMPPVGQDLVFSTAQIRYCLAEDIRMEGVKSALNNYIDSDVGRFNAMVADYNSRCGSYRYRSGALESARRDIEPYRSQLQSEGRSRFARSPSTGSLSMPAPSRPAPDATVQAIQRKLNELGYEAGTADGLMGRGTRSAIIAFQQDRGLAATGEADQALLLHLQRAPARSTANATAPSTYSSPPALATTPIPQPQRSLSSGKPDLSMASPSEQAAIENACGYHKRVNGPADYYRCQQTELSKLLNSGGQPDLSRVSAPERSSIENACGYHKRVNGPADYYRCQQTELSKLLNSGGQPDLSPVSASERASIENACGYHKRVNGPADYYKCLRSELNKLR
jgi:peptidoglycan hydrolase-like protein with peptidoglycan-binding domain